MTERTSDWVWARDGHTEKKTESLAQKGKEHDPQYTARQWRDMFIVNTYCKCLYNLFINDNGALKIYHI